MNEKQHFYVTTPIYYVTARPHLGSLYSTLIADVIARWNTLKGKQVFFLTGTDEHGQKVAQAAEKVGQNPQAFVDSFIDAYKQVWHQYELAYTYFIRTTDKDHVQAVQQWIRKLRDQGDIYKGFYKGWYCTHCETFVTEKEETNDTPLCPTCGRPTNILEEETYFFRLSAYQDKLLKFFNENPDFIVPKERSHEVINFVKEGLKDLSISRTTVTWGIPFPDDAHHITYVWADALNNYITAIGWGKPGKEKEFNQWWPADVHVLGKDIVRFHAVYWPAFLMATGLPMPKQLLVHGWIKINQQKMSKSFGNVIDPRDLYAAYGAEPVRYYLMRYMAITQDGEFSIADLEQKIGSDLADALGNLLNRMVTLAHKFEVYDVPAVPVWNVKSMELRDASFDMIEQYQSYMDEYLFHMALGQVWKFIHLTNAYFHEQEPWKMAKVDRAGFMEILSATSHSLKTIAMLLWPFMPSKMEQLLDSLGIQKMPKNNALENLELNIWNDHFMLKKIPNLFEKPEQKEPEATAQVDVQAVAVSAIPEIGIEDFAKIQLVVGGIEFIEEVAGSDKLLKLQVDFGDLGKRQILSGVKKSYLPQDLVGKQGVFILNLKPRKMMGFESHGMMLFAITDRQTALTLLSSVPNGTKIQ